MCILPLGAIAAEWEFVVESVDGNQLYVDKSGVKEEKGVKIFSYKVVHLEPANSEGIGFPINESIVKSSIDCEEKKVKNISAVAYGKEKKEKHVDLETGSRWVSIPADSNYDAIYRYVCFQH